MGVQMEKEQCLDAREEHVLVNEVVWVSLDRWVIGMFLCMCCPKKGLDDYSWISDYMTECEM